jgi:uncharacterized protein with HEPN domain
VRRIQRSTAGGREVFMADVDLQDATLRRLQTLSESAHRLSPEFKAAHPEVPWADIAGFRNRLVHAYLDIDLDLTWNTVQRDLAPLAQLAEAEAARLREAEPVDRTDEGSDELLG